MPEFSDVVNNFNWTALVQTLLRVVGVLLCLTVHEVSHGLVANALGDPTAKAQKRLSLNPIHHIDPVGALMMLALGFGWAKPVPVDASYFKKPKVGMALTALAGPVSNLIFAYITALGYTLVYGLLITQAVSGGFWFGLFQFLGSLLSLNIGLAVFNLIPFPPLDGSKVVEGFLPDKVTYTLWKYEKVGMVILLVLLFVGFFDAFGAPLTAVWNWLMDLYIDGSAWVLDLIL